MCHPTDYCCPFTCSSLHMELCYTIPSTSGKSTKNVLLWARSRLIVWLRDVKAPTCTLEEVKRRHGSAAGGKGWGWVPSLRDTISCFMWNQMSQNFYWKGNAWPTGDIDLLYFNKELRVWMSFSYNGVKLCQELAWWAWWRTERCIDDVTSASTRKLCHVSANTINKSSDCYGLTCTNQLIRADLHLNVFLLVQIHFKMTRCCCLQFVCFTTHTIQTSQSKVTVLFFIQFLQIQ